MAQLYFDTEEDYDKVVRLNREISKLKQELLSLDIPVSKSIRLLETRLLSASRELQALVESAARAGLVATDIPENAGRQNALPVTGGKVGGGSGTPANRQEGDQQSGETAAGSPPKGKTNDVKGLNHIKFAAGEAAKSVSSLGDRLKQIAEMSGDERLEEIASQLSAVGQNLQAAAQGFSSGGWIGAIVGGATNLLNQLIGSFMTAKAEAMEEERNREDFLNAYQLELLKVKDKDFDTVFGNSGLERAIEAAGKAKEAMRSYQEEVTKRTVPEIKKEFNSLGGALLGGGAMAIFGFSRSITNESKALLNAYEKGYSDLQGMAVKTRDYSGLANFFGKKDKYTSLFDLAPQLWGGSTDGEFNIELAKEFLRTNTQISEEQKKQIQHVIDLKEAYDANMQIIRQDIQETFGHLGDAASEAIVQAIVTGADAFTLFEDAGDKAIENLGKKLMYELFFAKKFEQLQTDLENSYGADPETTARNQTAILTDFFRDMEMSMPAAQDWAERWKAMAAESGFDIWNDEGVSQQSSRRGFETMSQDTADELNGRFTALQAAGEELRVQGILQTDSLSLLNTKLDAMLMINFYARNIADEIRTIQANSYLELVGVRENTEAIVRPVREMAADIMLIKQNIMKL